MNFLRLKSYKTYLTDGKSSFTFACADKSEVFVALIVGVEPLKITDASQYCDVDRMILAMADHIRAKDGAGRKKRKTIKH